MMNYSMSVYYPPIALRKACFQRHLSAQAAFIEGHACNHADVHFLAERKQFVFRCLIKDVVDDLHRIDQPRANCFQAIPRLPPVQAQTEGSDDPVLLQFLHCGSELRIVGP